LRDEKWENHNDDDIDDRLWNIALKERRQRREVIEKVSIKASRKL
jgi:hypothetical protein